MQRVATFMSVKPGLEERYVEEHRHIWPEILEGIRRFGIRNYSIFMHGRELYSYFEVDDLQHAMEMAAADPDNQRWQAHMADFFDISPGIQNGSTVTLTEVFHTDGYMGPLTRVQRVGALRQLKAGMEKEDELQRIWEKTLEDIARVRIRNYSVFQIGKMLFYYFQVEDREKAIRVLSASLDNQRSEKRTGDKFDIPTGIWDGPIIFLREVFFVE